MSKKTGIAQLLPLMPNKMLRNRPIKKYAFGIVRKETVASVVHKQMNKTEATAFIRKRAQIEEFKKWRLNWR